MRLDKYLKVSRLIKRRTVANEACDGERVTVNGRTAKASYDVKIGDVLEIRFGQKTVKVEVLNLSESTKKSGCSGHVSGDRLKSEDTQCTSWCTPNPRKIRLCGADCQCGGNAAEYSVTV